MKYETHGLLVQGIWPHVERAHEIQPPLGTNRGSGIYAGLYLSCVSCGHGLRFAPILDFALFDKVSDMGTDRVFPTVTRMCALVEVAKEWSDSELRP